MMDSLKPCKRCGLRFGRRIEYKCNRHTYRICCPKCGYCTKEQDTCEEAVNEWNGRDDDGTNS